MTRTSKTFKVDSDNGKVSVYIARYPKVMVGGYVLAEEEFEIYAYGSFNSETCYFEDQSNKGFSEILIGLFIWMKANIPGELTSSFMKELKDAIAKSRS